jgi:hypothetical protein
VTVVGETVEEYLNRNHLSLHMNRHYVLESDPVKKYRNGRPGHGGTRKVSLDTVSVSGGFPPILKSWHQKSEPGHCICFWGFPTHIEKLYSL